MGWAAQVTTKSGFRPAFTSQEGGPVGDIEFLVVDASFLAHKHKHAYERFKTGDGRASGHVYGSFKHLRNLVTSYRPKALVFVYDRGAAWRREMLPEYKANRRADPDAAVTVPHAPGEFVMTEGQAADWTPAPDVERLFRGVPGIHLAHAGAEADDLAAWFVSQNPSETREGSIALYTGDRDYWQLVNDEEYVAAILNRKPKGAVKAKSQNLWIREEQVVEEFGVPPRHVARIKALLGDDSDNIKGLQGASRPGKKDGLRAFVQTPAASAYFDADQETFKLPAMEEWLAAELVRQRDQMLKNHAVVDLSYAVKLLNQQVSATTGPAIRKQGGDVAGCLEVLVEFECESLLGQVEPLFKELAPPPSR